MLNRHSKAIAVLLVITSFSLPLLCLAELVEDAKTKECLVYKSKRDSVPVYEEPETTAKVIGRLSLGEAVCYLGEHQGYAIIDYARQDFVNGRAQTTQETQPRLAFVRLVELWEPGTEGSRDISRSFLEYLEYLRSGGIPDDLFAPFSGILSPFSDEPNCKAGKICEKIEKEAK